MPSHDKLLEYQDLIEMCHPALTDVWGTMDGLMIKINEALDEVTQSRFYNGWKHCHCFISVLYFFLDGTYPACYYNIPGCLHDSTVADWVGLYNKQQNLSQICYQISFLYHQY